MEKIEQPDWGDLIAVKQPVDSGRLRSFERNRELDAAVPRERRPVAMGGTCALAGYGSLDFRLVCYWRLLAEATRDPALRPFHKQR
jgi:hypothetical protein